MSQPSPSVVVDQRVPGVKGRYRRWYAIEPDDGRDYETIVAYLNMSMKKVERRYGIEVKRRTITKERGTDISPITSKRMYWIMEGRSWEREED